MFVFVLYKWWIVLILFGCDNLIDKLGSAGRGTFGSLCVPCSFARTSFSLYTKRKREIVTEAFIAQQYVISKGRRHIFKRRSCFTSYEIAEYFATVVLAVVIYRKREIFWRCFAKLINCSRKIIYIIKSLNGYFWSDWLKSVTHLSNWKTRRLTFPLMSIYTTPFR